MGRLTNAIKRIGGQRKRNVIETLFLVNMIYNKEENRRLRDWEINGTRRPFPPLYEAVKEKN